ncbi:MAG: DUF4331 domain-containing protein, partial [Thermomicrobiaceae bacterium]|nr:DUF4331 domain-containing protein [Thermomicrobiaceae bacterium]
YNTGPVTSKSDPDLNQEQFYDVSVRRPGDPRVGRTIGRNLQVAPANVGPVSFPDYAAVASQFVYSIDGDIKVFAGPRDDPFFVDLGGTFDLLHPRGKDDLAGLNVHSIAIQVPIVKLTANHQLPSGASDPNAILGVYTTASRQSMRVLRQLGAPGSSATQPVANSGPWVQISRLDLPLINEVVIPLKDKDRWNGSEPENDSQFLQYARTPELAGLIQAILGVTVPPTPRTDLLTILFKGIPGLNQPKNVVPATLLRLNVAIPPTASPNRLGVLGGDLQGFPNGRRLADDVVDIELQAVAGATPLTPDFNKAPNNTLGDGVSANDCAFASAFPYLANPHDYARRCGVSAP